MVINWLKLKVYLLQTAEAPPQKAILIEKQDGRYRLIVRGEAPTTVEAPFDDVTMGVVNAALEVQELAGRKIIDDSSHIITPSKEDGSGVDPLPFHIQRRRRLTDDCSGRSECHEC